MPLVLAIEPDARQASILRRVVKERVRADLVLVESKDAALAALATGIPDLILVTTLLAPRDEDELTEHLKTLDRATHVQTLAIPLLGSLRASEQPLGSRLLSALKRRRRDDAIDGCDPAVFAEQVQEYLKRAEELHLEEVSLESTVDSRKPEVESPESRPEDPQPAGVFESTVESRALEVESPELVFEPVIERRQPGVEAIESAFESRQSEVSFESEAESRAPDVERVRGSEFGVRGSGSRTSEPLNVRTSEPRGPAFASPRQAAEAPEIVPALLPLASITVAPLPLDLLERVLHGEKTVSPQWLLRADSVPPAVVTPRATASIVVSHDTALWQDLFNALEERLQQMLDDAPDLGDPPAPPGGKTNPEAAVTEPEPEVREPDAAELVAATPATVRKDAAADGRRRRRRNRPRTAPPAAPTVPVEAPVADDVQDEWGFYDPNRCGIAALMAKLDEARPPHANERRKRARIPGDSR